MPRQMPVPVPAYHARLLKVIDGDTVRLAIDRWFWESSERTLRLLETNTPELYARDPQQRVAARAAKDFTLAWLAEAALLNTSAKWPDLYPLVVQAGPLDVPLTSPDPHDSFGRMLGYLWRKSDGDCLNTRLNEEGHGEYVEPLLHLQRLANASADDRR